MLFSTPNGLEPYEMSSSHNGDVFVLCRPIVDGMSDTNYSILFRVDESSAKVLKSFDFAINGLIVNDGNVFMVDEENTLYRFYENEWTELEDELETPPAQLIVLRVIEDILFGLTTEGTIHRWVGNGWEMEADDEGETFFYDMRKLEDGDVIVSGAKGFLSVLNAGRFELIGIPVSTNIISILPFSDSAFLVTGSRGTIIRIKDEEIELIDTSGRIQPMINAILWDGRVLVSASKEILEVCNETAITFSETNADWIENADGRLWKLASEISYYSDGKWIKVSMEAEIEF